MSTPIALVILDGFGYRTEKEYNAIASAHTPTFDKLWNTYPHTTLCASANAVGLLPNYIGNSEVGHLTLGAGRIIQQPVALINQAIDDKTFFKNKILIHNLDKVAKSGKTLHIIGLLSDAGVHSHEKHLYAYLEAAQQYDIKKIVIHAILDGRDVPPKSAEKYLQKLSDYIANKPNIILGSIHGRFYAMDRDHNWERTDTSVDILTKAHTANTQTWQDVLQKQYQENISDEFITPTLLTPESTIQPSDGIIFINFRPDRARQLTERLLELPLAFLITPVSYNNKLNTQVLFNKQQIKDTLLDVLHEHNKKVFTIAETEKYAHVTYFFAGGREQQYPNETRVLIPSIVTKTYIDHPCMSAKEITQAAMESLEYNPQDFYLINYANPDMVGHSGDFDATVKAIECVDQQLEKLYNQIVQKMNGTLLVTADHGNAELMFDQSTGQPHTAHTTNPVPFIAVSEHPEKLSALKGIANIAPYILNIMHLPIPKEMSL